MTAVPTNPLHESEIHARMAKYVLSILLKPGLSIPAVQAELFIEAKEWLKAIEQKQLTVRKDP